MEFEDSVLYLMHPLQFLHWEPNYLIYSVDHSMVLIGRSRLQMQTLEVSYL